MPHRAFPLLASRLETLHLSLRLVPHHQLTSPGPFKRLFVLEKLPGPIYNVNPMIRCRRQFHFDSILYTHLLLYVLNVSPLFLSSPAIRSQWELCNPTGSSEPVDRLSLVEGLFG